MALYNSLLGSKKEYFPQWHTFLLNQRMFSHFQKQKVQATCLSLSYTSWEPSSYTALERRQSSVADTSKTLQLTPKQSRWRNNTTGKRKHMYFLFLGWSVSLSSSCHMLSEPSICHIPLSQYDYLLSFPTLITVHICWFLGQNPPVPGGPWPGPASDVLFCWALVASSTLSADGRAPIRWDVLTLSRSQSPIHSQSLRGSKAKCIIAP